MAKQQIASYYKKPKVKRKGIHAKSKIIIVLLLFCGFNTVYLYEFNRSMNLIGLWIYFFVLNVISV